MELSSLDAFVKVVQAGSFTRAADLLHSQKAHLSRVVTQLEVELGVRLLERTTRSLSLTEVGREFFERAVGILSAAEDAKRAVQKAQGEPRGTLRLTCGVEFGMMVVNRWVTRYLQQHTQVRADVELTGRIVDLVHEGFDLAIRLGELPDANLAARKLGEIHYGLFAAPNYLKRRGLPSSPERLDTHELIQFSGSRQRRGWQLTREGKTLTVAVAAHARMKANNSYVVRDAALDGLGIAQLPLLLARPAVEAGLLQPVLPEWLAMSVPVHAVFASARYLTPKVRAFIDLAASGPELLER